jgi:hypothetical protein
MSRDRIALIALSLTVALGASVSCVTSESDDPNAGKVSGGAGQHGAAGNSGGSAGAGNTSGGSAGAGNTSGGSAGAGNTSGGSAGMNGTAGAGNTSGGSAGMNGAAGSNGSAGNGSAGSMAGMSGGSAGSMAGMSGGSAGAGGGTAGMGGGTTLSFATDIYTPIIKTQCAPCHTTNTDGNLSMKDAATAYTNLVGANMMGVAAKNDLNCKLLDTKKLRVEPGDPDNSYLYIKINNTDAQLGGTMMCGPAMPKTGSNLTLTMDQKTKIHDWIMGGAKM